MSTIPESGPADLSGRTAVVTGAAGGIGKAVSEALADEGADIVAADIDADELDRLEETLGGAGQSIESVECDVTDTEDIERLAAVTFDEHDAIDIVTTLHGAINRKDIPTTTVDDWNLDIQTNLTGTFLVLREFWNHLVENEYGKIVCIGSLAGTTGGLEASASYSAAKAGIHAMVKTAAQEGAPHSIYANAIAPGPISTSFNDLTIDDIDPASQPIRRMGQPEDIAQGVVFLASQQSNWITGSVFNIDGGATMR